MIRDLNHIVFSNKIFISPGQDKKSNIQLHKEREERMMAIMTKRLMEEERDVPDEVYSKRSCRSRQSMSYRFTEYDNLINSAIGDDIKEESYEEDSYSGSVPSCLSIKGTHVGKLDLYLPV